MRCGKFQDNGKRCRHFLTNDGECRVHSISAPQGIKRRHLLTGIFALVFFMLWLSQSPAQKDISPWQQDIERALSRFAHEPDDAIEAVEKIIQSTTQTEGVSDEQIAQLWTVLAHQHWRRWHVLKAIEALEQAQRWKADKQRLDQLAQLRTQFRQMQSERRNNRHYVANRDAGSAQNLNDRIVIADIFVDLPNNEKWGNKDRLLALKSQESMDEWLKKYYQRYLSQELHIEHRQYAARASELKVLSQIKHPNDVLAHVSSAYEKTFDQALRDIVATENGANVALVLHYPKESRSFAFPCRGASKHSALMANKISTHACQQEFAVITHKLEHNNWPHVAVTQVHEALHLFGADDLYVVGGAENYDTTDIMHYSYPRLQDAHLNPLTAWSIGWIAERPQAPFIIEED